MSSNYSFGRKSAVYRKKKNFTFFKALFVLFVVLCVANILAMKKTNENTVQVDVRDLIVQK